jgi:hypothetical protein
MNLYRFWIGERLWYSTYSETEKQAWDDFSAAAWQWDVSGARCECITPEESLIRSYVNTEK